MASVLDIITYAMRSSGVLASGDEPTASEGEDGLAALQSFYDELVAQGMFGRLTDSYLTTSDTAQEGFRYLLGSGVTLTEPTTISAEDSEDGITRQPRDLALYESLTNAGVRSVRLYDRTGWVNLIDLALTDIAPLSSRGAMGLAAALACSGGFCDMFGVTPTQPLLARSQRFLSSLTHKLGSTQDRLSVEYM